jgi:FkbM family methyltransferase
MSLEPGEMGIRVAAGVTVAVPSRVDLMTPYVLLEQEDWFEDELAFLCRRTRTGARIVDIGANYGLYTLSLAKVAGPSGRVWAIEPASPTARFLRKSAGINGLAHVTVIQKALSDREGTARLSLESNPELNSISGDPAGAQTEEVQLSTLDVLARENDWAAVDFLKIDAEGEEARIIDGGAAFLRSANPLVMFEIKHGERVNLQLVEKLAALGYRSYQLVPGLAILVPFDSSTPPDPYRLNLFACNSARAALLECQGALARDAAPSPAPLDWLAHYRAAHDENAAPAARHAHLQAAYAAMQGAHDAYGLGTCARLARELGHRQRAIDFLERALGAVRNPVPPKSAFLPASPGFDAIDAAGRPAEWLQASLVDALVALSGFSTYFAPGTPHQQATLDRLEALKASGFQRAPMERRRQLLRIVSGLQQGTVPAASLARSGPDNLNPDLWGGAEPG